MSKKKKTKNITETRLPKKMPELTPSRDPSEPAAPEENPPIVPESPFETSPSEMPIPRKDL